MNEHVTHPLDAKGPSVPNPGNPAGPPENHQERKAAVFQTDEETMEWEAKIETPPPRPAQTVTVRFVEGGKRPIRIGDFEDSEDDS